MCACLSAPRLTVRVHPRVSAPKTYVVRRRSRERCVRYMCPYTPISTVRTRMYVRLRDYVRTPARIDAHRNPHDCVNTGAYVAGGIMYAASTMASRYPYTSVHYCDSSLRQYWPKGFHCDCLPRTYTYTALGPGLYVVPA